MFFNIKLATNTKLVTKLVIKRFYDCYPSVNYYRFTKKIKI